MKLSPTQVEQFRRHGYLAVPGFFDARETAALQADIARLKRNGFLRNVATAGDGKTPSREKVNLQLCPANFYSTLIRALPFAPKVLEAVTRLLGPDEVATLLKVSKSWVYEHTRSRGVPRGRPRDRRGQPDHRLLCAQGGHRALTPDHQHRRRARYGAADGALRRGGGRGPHYRGAAAGLVEPAALRPGLTERRGRALLMQAARRR